MFPPFNQDLAKTECLSLMQKLDLYQSIDFCAIESGKNPDPKLSTDYLFKKNLGIMFGVLICKDALGNTYNLKAFSGQFNSIWNVKGWVPPLLDENAFNQLIKDSDKEIHELTDKIEILEKEQNKNLSLIKELKQKRKNLSNQSMKDIFALYQFYTFDGSKKDFSQIIKDDELPPTGCGEC